MLLPPSPNWYAPGCVCADKNGRLAYAANSRIVVLTPKLQNWPEVSIFNKAHSERVSCVLWVNVEKGDLASAGDDGKVKLWNSTTKAFVAEHGEHGQNKIVAISAFPVAPKYIVSGDARANIILWNAETLIARKSLFIGTKLPPLAVMACSPFDDHTVALGFQQGTFMLIDTRQRGDILWKVVKGHDDAITNISWCPSARSALGDTPMLLSSSKTKIVVWDTADKREVTTFRPYRRYKPKMQPFNTAYWLDADTIIGSGCNSELVVWDLKVGRENLISNGQEVHKLHSREIYNIASTIDPEGKTIIWTSSQDRRLIQFRLDLTKGDDPAMKNTSVKPELGDCLLDLQTLGGFVNCIKTCSTDAAMIAIAVGDGQIRVLNSAHPSRNDQPVWMKWKPHSLSWHPEKEGFLAFGAEDGRVGVVETLNNYARTFTRYLKGNVYTVQWVKWQTDSEPEKYYVWACGGKTIGIYDYDNLESGRLTTLSRLMGKENGNEKPDVTDFCWSDDYKLLAVGTDSGMVSIFKRNGGKLEQIGKLIASRKLVNTMAWLSSDKADNSGDIWLAVGSEESSVKIFSISSLLASADASESSTVQPHTILEGHKEKVCAVAWSPDQRGVLATASVDNTVRVWKAFTGELLSVFSDPLGTRFFSVEWSHWEEDLLYCGGDKSCLFSVKPSQNPPIEVKKEKKEVKKEEKKETKEKREYPKKPKSLLPLVASAENRGKSGLYDDCLAVLDCVINGKHSDEISVGLYLEGDDLLRCVEKEMEHHIGADGGEQFLILHVWSNKLWEEALEKLKDADMLNDFLFAVNKLDSPAWKSAAEHYAKQLIKSNDSRKAATLYHLLERPEDAIEVLLADNLVREALVYAKLNFPSGDDRIVNVAKTFAQKLVHGGAVIEVAAKVYISLKDFDSAIATIMKRTDPLATLVASELAKQSSSDVMSKVYAVQCVYDALIRSEHAVARRALALNDGFYWCQPVIDIHTLIAEKNEEVNTGDEKVNGDVNGHSTVNELEFGDLQNLSQLQESANARWDSEKKEAVVAQIKKNFCSGQVPTQLKQMLVHLSGRLAISLLSTKSKEALVDDVRQVCSEYLLVGGDMLPGIVRRL